MSFTQITYLVMLILVYKPYAVIFCKQCQKGQPDGRHLVLVLLVLRSWCERKTYKVCYLLTILTGVFAAERFSLPIGLLLPLLQANSISTVRVADIQLIRVEYVVFIELTLTKVGTIKVAIGRQNCFL